MADQVLFFDLGMLEYQEAWQLQKKLQQERIKKKIPDLVLFLEHPPVFTIGRRSRPEDLLLPQEKLQQRGFSVFSTDRGGQITYHGPGQLVVYLILDLHNYQKSICWYVHTLEEASLQALSHWQIPGQRIPGLTGVWVGDEKIAAIGVRMSRWVTMHGFSFNVSLDLSHYRFIIPCGIRDRGVTSLQKLLPSAPSMEEVKEVFQKVLCQLFAWGNIPPLQKASPPSLWELLSF